ncbi:MAG: MFS transporter [Actinomycetota bacterium]
MTGSDDRRHAIVVALALFTVGFGTNVSTPLLVRYQERLDLGQTTTLSIFVVYVAGILSTLLIAGPLSDRFGRRPIVVPFVAASGVASLILILGRDSLLALYVGRLLLGVVSGAVIGTGSAWIQEQAGRGNELRMASITTAVLYGGFGLGPAVTAAMEQLLPAPLVLPYLLHAAMAFALVPFVARVPETHRPQRRRPLRIELGIPPGRRTEFLLVLAPTAFWVYGFASSAFALFPVLLRDALDDVDVLVGGATAALTAWSGIMARPISERFGARRGSVIGLWSGTIGLAFGAVAFATDVWPLILPAAVLVGASSGILLTAGLTIISESTGDDTRGALTSAFYVAAYLGMTVPVLVSLLGRVVSTTSALIIVTAVALVTTVGLTNELRRPAALR